MSGPTSTSPTGTPGVVILPVRFKAAGSPHRLDLSRPVQGAAAKDRLNLSPTTSGKPPRWFAPARHLGVPLPGYHEASIPIRAFGAVLLGALGGLFCAGACVPFLETIAVSHPAVGYGPFGMVAMGLVAAFGLTYFARMGWRMPLLPPLGPLHGPLLGPDGKPVVPPPVPPPVVNGPYTPHRGDQAARARHTFKSVG